MRRADELPVGPTLTKFPADRKRRKAARRHARPRREPHLARTSLLRPREEEWLLIEWPKGEVEPTRYFLSTLPADISFKDLVAGVKMRWRIERDYLELK